MAGRRRTLRRRPRPVLWASCAVVSSLLLDTNVVSEATRPQPDQRVLQRLADAEGMAAIAAVSWHELVYGVERLRNGRRRNALTVFLTEVHARYPVLAYDGEAAGWHARERARLERDGLSRTFADGQIAAVAVTNSLVLVTRNVTDFDGFSGLRVENWWDENGRR